MNAAVGDLVAYEDQANPRTVYRVARYITGYGVEYELVKVETGEVTFSDLRQSGWTQVCSTCEQIKAEGGFGPRHNASRRCESGGYNHCTCDICF